MHRTVLVDGDASEIFKSLKSGYIRWRAALSPADIEITLSELGSHRARVQSQEALRSLRLWTMIFVCARHTMGRAVNATTNAVASAALSGQPSTVDRTPYSSGRWARTRCPWDTRQKYARWLPNLRLNRRVYSRTSSEVSFAAGRGWTKDACCTAALRLSVGSNVFNFVGVSAETSFVYTRVLARAGRFGRNSS